MMMRTVMRLFGLALLLLPHVSQAQVKEHYILVLSKAEQKLEVLDYVTLEPIGSIPVGEDPHEIVLSPDQATAYISNPMMNKQGHAIHVVNLKEMKLEKVIDTAPFYIPHGLAYVQDRLWFTAQGAKAVAVYDVREGRVAEVFGTGQDFTHMLHVTPGATRFYTTNVESGTVSIFEKAEIPPYMPPTGVLPPNAQPRLEWRQTLVDTGVGSEGFDISTNGKELWTARPDGHVVIVDLESKQVRADIDTGVQGLHRLKFTPDGKSVAIVSVKTGDLLFYDAKTYKREIQSKICQGAGIFMDGPSNRMFVSCTPNNQVAVIDLETREVIMLITLSFSARLLKAAYPPERLNLVPMITLQNYS